MEQDIKYFKGWIVFFLIVIFLGFLSSLIIAYPVAIVLIFLGLSAASAPLFQNIATLILTAFLSFFIYKWSIQNFILTQIKTKMNEKA